MVARSWSIAGAQLTHLLPAAVAIVYAMPVTSIVHAMPILSTRQLAVDIFDPPQATDSYEELYRLCTNRVLPDDVHEEYDRGHLLEPPQPTEIAPDILGQPEAVFKVALQDRHADWTAAIRAASKILEPEYTLRDFYNDVKVAFPELSLYTVVKANPNHGSTDVSSGVSGKDEYAAPLGRTDLVCGHACFLSRPDTQHAAHQWLQTHMAAGTGERSVRCLPSIGSLALASMESEAFHLV